MIFMRSSSSLRLASVAAVPPREAIEMLETLEEEDATEDVDDDMLPVHCVDGGGLAEHDWAGEQTWDAKARRSSSLAETPNRFLLLSKASRLISTHPGPPTNAQNSSKPLERANSSIEFELGPSSSRSNELELELTNFRTIELVRPFPGWKVRQKARYSGQQWEHSSGPE